MVHNGTLKEFLETIHELAPPGASPEVIKGVVDDFVVATGRDHFYQKDVATVLELLNRRHEEKLSLALRPLPHTVGLRLAELELRRVLQPAAEHVRVGLFGSSDPPFSDQTEASEWLVRMEKEQPKRTAEERQEIDRLLKLQYETRMRLAELGRHISVEESWVTLSRLDPDASQGEISRHEPVFVYGPGPLRALERAVSQLAEQTGLPTLAVQDFILIGEGPHIPAWRVRPRDLFKKVWVDDEAIGAVRRKEVTITLRSPDITDVSLRQLVRAILKGFRGGGRPRADEDDLRLREVVSELVAEDPHEPPWSNSFWENEVLPAWSASGGSKTSSRALREKYRRLVKKHWEVSGVSVAVLDELPDE